MEVEDLTKHALIWRIWRNCNDKDNDCIYVVMEEGELIFLKEIEVEQE